ncbi:hypothetical protein B0H11DRAFT_1903980 [Mycena galericulata]|nr:hypothetical protein B0H11DRAFT_1903980 [Mycena galericulata]
MKFAQAEIDLFEFVLLLELLQNGFGLLGVPQHAEYPTPGREYGYIPSNYVAEKNNCGFGSYTGHRSFKCGEIKGEVGVHDSGKKFLLKVVIGARSFEEGDLLGKFELENSGFLVSLTSKRNTGEKEYGSIGGSSYEICRSKGEVWLHVPIFTGAMGASMAASPSRQEFFSAGYPGQQLAVPSRQKQWLTAVDAFRGSFC